MKLSGELKAFEGRIGHHFAQPSLLVQSVIHASMSSANRDDNQRLEFLGDRELGLVMAEALIDLDPGEDITCTFFNFGRSIVKITKSPDPRILSLSGGESKTTFSVVIEICPL